MITNRAVVFFEATWPGTFCSFPVSQWHNWLCVRSEGEDEQSGNVSKESHLK